MDKKLFPTNEGTPQGGVISPLLANIALHGLEELIMGLAPNIDMKRPDKTQTQMAVRDKQKSLSLIRYADDFVVLHEDLEVIQMCKRKIEEWLTDLSLELKPSKTRISHTLNKVCGEFIVTVTKERFGLSRSTSTLWEEIIGHSLPEVGKPPIYYDNTATPTLIGLSKLKVKHRLLMVIGCIGV